jgi:hypothetical protein
VRDGRFAPARYLTRFLVIVEMPVHRSVSFGHQKEQKGVANTSHRCVATYF